MVTDLPDYTKREVLVIDIADFPQEVMVDHRKILGETLKIPTEPYCLPSSIENIVRINHEQIKGLALKDPTVALSVPVSWEGPYVAYEPCLDAWKTQIVDWAAGTLDVNIKSITGTVIQQIDLAKVLGAALSHSNPVISRLTNGAAFIDPRDRNWTITESLARSWYLGSSDIPDLLDKAGRLLGIVYGSLDKLQQQATTKELLVQIAHQGVIKDPTQIRALTASDIVTAKQSDETLLKATVTQLAKDRTVSSVDATATPLQINLAANNGNSAALYTPAAGKAIRIKFISLEQSADVDLGYRFGAAGTIYYLRTTKGLYVSNLIGCNNQGAADAALYLNSSAATNIKGYILLVEV